MNEFYLYAEKNGVKWYKCKRCQAAARGSIPAGGFCPVCNPRQAIHNYKELKITIDTIKKQMDNEITALLRP